MGAVKKISSIFFNKKAYKKMLAYGVLILLLYIFKDFLGIFLLTFIFAYFFSNIASFIKNKFISLGKKVKVLKILSKIPYWIIILVEYLIFLGIIVLIVANIIPSISKEIKSLSNGLSIEESIVISNEGEIIVLDNENEKRIKSGSEKIVELYKNKKQQILDILEEKDPKDNMGIRDNILNFEENLDFSAIKEAISNGFKSFGNGLGKFVLALILSFIFIIDRKKTENYLYRIKESNFSFIYEEYDLLMEKIVKSFGLILKAQSMIAFANSVLTIIGLFVIGFIFRNSSGEYISMFPYMLTLWLVVFVFGFIPVLGVVLSSVPIFFVGYATYGDPMIIVAIGLLILIVHMVEAYYLNPKIISKFLELPVSLTFVILIISEHLFGLAGLLIGISLFYFIVGLLKDFNKMLEEKKKKKLRTFFTKKKN